MKVAKELLRLCFRTQKSVYESRLGQKEVKVLIQRLKNLIDFTEDVVYIIPISDVIRFGVNSIVYKYIHLFI